MSDLVKPTGFFKCPSCKRVWRGEELAVNSASLGTDCITWFCKDKLCCAFVDTTQPIDKFAILAAYKGSLWEVERKRSWRVEVRGRVNVVELQVIGAPTIFAFRLVNYDTNDKTEFYNWAWLKLTPYKWVGISAESLVGEISNGDDYFNSANLFYLTSCGAGVDCESEETEKEKGVS